LFDKHIEHARGQLGVSLIKRALLNKSSDEFGTGRDETVSSV